MKRYDLSPATLGFLVLLLAFFGAFLFYPVGLLLKGAFVAEGRFSLRYFEMLLASPLQREALANSFAHRPAHHRADHAARPCRWPG